MSNVRRNISSHCTCGVLRYMYVWRNSVHSVHQHSSISPHIMDLYSFPCLCNIRISFRRLLLHCQHILHYFMTWMNEWMNEWILLQTVRYMNSTGCVHGRPQIIQLYSQQVQNQIKKKKKDTQLSLQLTITKTLSHNHCFKMTEVQMHWMTDIWNHNTLSSATGKCETGSLTLIRIYVGMEFCC